jgi:hypothetical protein
MLLAFPEREISKKIYKLQLELFEFVESKLSPFIPIQKVKNIRRLLKAKAGKELSKCKLS